MIGNCLLSCSGPINHSALLFVSPCRTVVRARARSFSAPRRRVRVHDITVAVGGKEGGKEGEDGTGGGGVAALVEPLPR